MDVNLIDGVQHDLELYFADWDNKGRAETVQISDATTGAVLSTQTISSFQSGVYLDYAVSGHIVITITRTAGSECRPQRPLPRPVVHGDARTSRQDATTQGTWIGTYGAQGYDIVAGPVSLPGLRHGHALGPVDLHLDRRPRTDPRALQVPGSSNRIAAVWYSASSFSVDVNLTDGLQHDLELYFADWDNRAGPRRCRSATRRRAPC